MGLRARHLAPIVQRFGGIHDRQHQGKEQLRVTLPAADPPSRGQRERGGSRLGFGKSVPRILIVDDEAAI